MSVSDMINKLPEALNADAAADTNATIQFNTTEPKHIRIADGACTVSDGTADSPDVTLTMDDDDLADMLTGELNGMTAFMTGKLQLDGDMMLAQKIVTLFDPAKLK